MVEYIRLSGGEGYFGQKNLLQSQLFVLDMLKRIRAYKLLRQEELLLKVMIKNKLKEIIETFETLKKILPVYHYKKIKKEEEKVVKKNVEHLTLEDEIKLIEEKIAKLKKNL